MSCVRRYLTENYNHLYRLARKYVGSDLAGDLLNDLCLNYLNENDHAEQLCERGELGAYLNRTMQICGFSSSSPFYKKYKKLKKVLLHYQNEGQCEGGHSEPTYEQVNMKSFDERLNEAANIDNFLDMMEDRPHYRVHWLDCS